MINLPSDFATPQVLVHAGDGLVDITQAPV